MSKVLIIGDLHIGARNGSSFFNNVMFEYFEQFLFPYILDNNIKYVVQLGDILDKRKTVDFLTSLSLIKFFDFFHQNEIHFYSTIGNHDIYYKQSVKVSGTKQFSDVYHSEYINIIDVPTVEQLGFSKFVLIPWVCDETREAVNYCLSNHAKNGIICGHFELAGFNLQKNVVCPHGTTETSILREAKKVFSGHFHTPSDNGNICYVGTPYYLTWNDYGDRKRIIEYDTLDDTYKEIFNENEIFHKIVYVNDKKIMEQTIDNMNIRQGSYVKLYVQDPDIFLDQFINELNEKFNLNSCVVIDTSDSSYLDNEEYNISVDNPIEIMIKTIKNINNINHEFVEKEIISIYKEAQAC